jgi:hypothetical protein
MLLAVRVWPPGLLTPILFQRGAKLFFRLLEVRFAVTKIEPAHHASEKEHTRDQDSLMEVLHSGQP